jgi:hypothetical protein
MMMHLAQTLPDPNSAGALGWVIVAVGAVIMFIGSLVAAVLGFLSLIEKIRGSTKVNATTKSSDDGPGRIEFDLHIAGLREDLTDLKAGQNAMMGKLEAWSGAQYRARGRMHRDINTLKNAMNFWAGKMAGQGDPDAQRLVDILAEAEKSGGDDE